MGNVTNVLCTQSKTIIDISIEGVKLSLSIENIAIFDFPLLRTLAPVRWLLSAPIVLALKANLRFPNRRGVAFDTAATPPQPAPVSSDREGANGELKEKLFRTRTTNQRLFCARNCCERNFSRPTSLSPPSLLPLRPPTRPPPLQAVHRQDEEVNAARTCKPEQAAPRCFLQSLSRRRVAGLRSSQGAEQFFPRPVTQRRFKATCCRQRMWSRRRSGRQSDPRCVYGRSLAFSSPPSPAPFTAEFSQSLLPLPPFFPCSSINSLAPARTRECE